MGIKDLRKIPTNDPRDPPAIWRHIKPSEAYPHKREHYNPRPYDPLFYPMNFSSFCRRKRPNGMSAKEYAQLCDATPPWEPRNMDGSMKRRTGTKEADEQVEPDTPIDVPTTFRPETKNGL